MRRTLLLLLLLSLGTSGRAAVLRVSNTGGPPHDGLTWAGAFATVQAGLDAAHPGDEVWVAAGAYPESIILPAGVALYGGFNGTETARDQRDPRRHDTVLQGAPDGLSRAAVAFAQEATPVTVLDGFTIQRTAKGSFRDGVLCGGASPTIRNNVIRGNAGYGIRLASSSAVVENNRIVGNGGESQSPGGYSDSNGGIFSDGGAPVLRGNVIAGNASSGISVWSGRADIENNTIVSNGSAYGGGVYGGNKVELRLVNNIIAYNASGLYAPPATGSLVLKNNCVYANRLDFREVIDPTGRDGNIRENPRLVDLARGDFHLRPDSPCRDAGENVAPADARDLDGDPRMLGGRVDIGADESDGALRPPPAPLIIRVKPDGDDAGDGTSWATAKRTLQASVDAASRDGGEVWAAAGVYQENLTLPAYSYLYGGFTGLETRREERDPRRNNTVVDGSGEPAVLAFAGYRVSRVDGFTLRNGSQIYRQGVILCGPAGPVFENNVVLGRFYSDGAATLRHCLVVGNISGSLDRLEHCRVTGSPWQAVWISTFQIPARIANNVIWGNGSGIEVSGGAEIVNNTIVGNAGDGFGTTSGRYIVANNIFANNRTGINAGDVFGRPSAAIVAAWTNCLYNNATGDWAGLPDQTGVNGNIATDPLLAAPQYGDFHIQPASPCRDTGDSLSVLPGERDMDGQPRILGRAVDIGADESAGTAWNTGPATLHVRPDGSDAADGLTWAKAVQSIPLAVAAAPGGEVWVAAGTYRGAGLTLNGVALYGGFAGTETAREQRDPRANVTVLDAEHKGNVVIVPPFAPETTVLDGFTVQNGEANHGGGVLLLEVSRAVISNNVIRDNAAIRGGGIMVESNATPTIARNVIHDNEAAGGGGIEFWTDGRGVVKNNVLYRNTANFGPGIFASAAYTETPGPFLYNNTIMDRVEVWIGNPVLTNNILGANASPETGRWTFNLFTAGGQAPTDADGNIFNPSAGFDVAYHLGPNSPAINAGDNAVVAEGDTDLDGRPRIVDGRVDIGAFEFVPGGPTAADAATALRIAAGLTTATPDLAIRLNVDNTGASKDVVDIADAIRLLRGVR